MSFNSKSFTNYIDTTLTKAGLYSKAASNLLLGTCAAESDFGTHFKQVKGPALGVFQIEPKTAIDIWENFLAFRPELTDAVKEVGNVLRHTDLDLEYNLRYQILMARVHYLRVREPLPYYGDIKRLAEYWKTYYNTVYGKGTVAKFIDKTNRYKAF